VPDDRRTWVGDDERMGDRQDDVVKVIVIPDARIPSGIDRVGVGQDGSATTTRAASVGRSISRAMETNRFSRMSSPIIPSTVDEPTDFSTPAFASMAITERTRGRPALWIALNRVASGATVSRPASSGPSSLRTSIGRAWLARRAKLAPGANRCRQLIASSGRTSARSPWRSRGGRRMAGLSATRDRTR